MVTDDTKSIHVHKVFSQIAHRYDLMNSVLSFQQHRLWRRFAMKQLQLRPGDNVLDVAAGTGDWTFSLANTVGSAGHVIGIDFCQEMLDVGIDKMAKEPVKYRHVTLMHGNAMELPFEDSKFRAVTIGFALRNVPDVATVLTEMKRVVMPGGQVVSLELSKPTSPFFRSLYYFYFQRILPLIGALAIGKLAPYAWLPESLRSFPDRIALENIFREVGLENVKSFPLTGGVAALHIGTKPEASKG